MPGIFPSGNQCVRGADECHPNLVSRSDDTEEVVERRFEEYELKTKPLLDYYAQKGTLRSFEVHKGVKDIPELLKLMEQLV